MMERRHGEQGEFSRQYDESTAVIKNAAEKALDEAEASGDVTKERILKGILETLKNVYLVDPDGPAKLKAIRRELEAQGVNVNVEEKRFEP